MSGSEDIIYRYWGKARSDDDTGPGYHLLPYHCLDVAAVGWVLLNPEKSLCLRMATPLGVEPAWLRDFFVFCLALHDMGKFSRAFQGLITDLSPDLVKANPRMLYTERHDTLGFWLWRKNLSNQLLKPLSGNCEWLNKIERWLEIVTGHHGMPPKKSDGRISNFFEREDEEAGFHFVCNVYTLFLSEFDHAALLDKNLKKRLRTISWQLAGIAVMADWLGSNQEYFKYCSEPEEFAVYWRKHALPSAKKSDSIHAGKAKNKPVSGSKQSLPFY